jgi:hypothetical protein
MRTRCASFGSYGCDSWSNIQAANATWFSKLSAYMQLGSYGNFCGNSLASPGPDCLTCPHWSDAAGDCSGVAGSSGGGQLDTVVNAFVSAGFPAPRVDVFFSSGGKYGALCFHECDLGVGNSGSWASLPPSEQLMLLWVLGETQPSGGSVGGSVGGDF